MGQAILDIFPYEISQFGLLGCGYVSLLVIGLLVGIVVLLVDRRS